MSSGATSVLAPPKPWERSREVSLASAVPVTVASNSNTAAPPLPALPVPAPSFNSAPSMPYSSPYSSAPYSSYPQYSPYNNSVSPYSSYSSPYSSYPYSSYSAGQHPFPNYSLESSTRPLLDSLNHIIQAVNHVACFLDSTVFSVWTAVSAITGIISALKNIKEHRWLLWLKTRLKAIKAASGKKRIILLTVILSALLATHLFTKEEVKNQNSNNDEQSSAIESNPIAVAEEEFTFVRANYAFEPSSSSNADGSNQLSFQAGDVIAISKSDASTIEAQISKWIVGRMKDGRSGFFPSNYVSTIK